MLKHLKLKSHTEYIWFILLAMYILSTYLAQDVLLPSVINSVMLYLFLAFSFLLMVSSRVVIVNNLLRWEVLSLMLAFIAMLYSPDFSVFSGTYYSMIVNVVLILVLTQMPWNRNCFKMILNIYVISAVLLMIGLIVTGNIVDSNGRLGETLFGNANIFAIMLMSSAIYGIWLMLSADKNVEKFFYLVEVVVIYYGMLLSGGRKYVIVPMIFLYVLLLNKTDKNGKMHLVRNTIVAGILFFILYYFIMEVPYFYKIIGWRFESFLSFFDDSKIADGSTIKRAMMIEAAWEKWKENPLFGYGFDSFKYYNKSSVTGNFYYSHNNFVELLYNQGIIGFIGYYSIYISLFCITLKNRMPSLDKGFSIGIIVGLLFYEYTGISYSMTPPHMMLFFVSIILNSFGREV